MSSFVGCICLCLFQGLSVFNVFDDILYFAFFGEAVASFLGEEQYSLVFDFEDSAFGRDE
jgi:hypothetical protein